MKIISPLFIFLSILMILSSCEKEITVDLPPYQKKLVVEGNIEPGMPPIILLSRSSGYFDATDLNAYLNSFVNGAQIYMDTPLGRDTLVEICTSSLPPEILPLVEQFTGIPAADLAALNICLYTTLDTAYWGKVGHYYNLTIISEGETVTASTTIQQPVPLDSTYFKLEPNTGNYGFMWATITEPAGRGNAYRWFARRLNLSADGAPKDPTFSPPFGSSFNDEFIESLTFDFAYTRPRGGTDEGNDREDYYTYGDTVVIKFTAIPFEAYEFLSAVENQQGSQGSPFASPSSIPSNINGGLGLWVGYSPAYDTVICAP